MNRWLELRATSNSGKTMFACRSCGRMSPVPDKDCPKVRDGLLLTVPCSCWPMTTQQFLNLNEGSALLIGELLTQKGKIELQCAISPAIVECLTVLQIEDDLATKRRKL